MTTSIRSEATRSVIVVNGIDQVAINSDGSMELLVPNTTPTGNDVVSAVNFDSLKSGNGYQKLPNGLIIQWIHSTNLGTQGAPSTWPIAFPTACLFAGVFCQNGSSAHYATVGAKTTTTVTAFGSAVPINIGFIGIGY